MAKTIIGLFDSLEIAQDVVTDFVNSGFKREQISLVTQEAHKANAVGDDNNNDDAAGTGAVSGSLLGGALGLLVGTGLLIIPGIGPVLAAGPLAAAIGTTMAAVGATALGAGIGAATGGLAGALVGEGVPQEEAHYYTEGVRRGGRLVLVQTNEENEARAHTIMESHGAANIHERVETWRADGWTGTDQQGMGNIQAEGQRDWENSSKVGTAVGTASGAATGAMMGSVAGPVGTVVGGVVGAATGAGTGAVGDALGKHSEHTNGAPVMGDSSHTTDRVTPFSTNTATNRTSGFENYDLNFRNHFQGNYADRGATYDQYLPSYRYGYDQANHPTYAGRDWSSSEADLRNQWSGTTRGSWDQLKDAVHYAWNRARGIV